MDNLILESCEVVDNKLKLKFIDYENNPNMYSCTEIPLQTFIDTINSTLPNLVLE